MCFRNERELNILILLTNIIYKQKKIDLRKKTDKERLDRIFKKKKRKKKESTKKQRKYNYLIKDKFRSRLYNIMQSFLINDCVHDFIYSL